MRLAVLSDIHGNLLALEAVLSDLKQAGGADKIWLLGDLVAFGSRPIETLQLIRTLPEALVIRGNHDRYLVTGQRTAMRPAKNEAELQEHRNEMVERDNNYNWTLSKLSFADYEYLVKLRHEVDLEVPGYGWVIGYHGTPGSDEGIIKPDTPAEEALDQLLDREGRLGIGGHTHRAMDRDLGRWRLINAGSIGAPQDETRPCYALITFADGTAQVDLRRVEYNMDATIADLQQCGNPSWEFMVEMLRMPLQQVQG